MKIQLKERVIENPNIKEFLTKEVYLSKKRWATTSMYDWYKRKFDVDEIQVAILDESSTIQGIYALDQIVNTNRHPAKIVPGTKYKVQWNPKVRIACFLPIDYNFDIENYIQQRTREDIREKQWNKYWLCMEGWINNLPIIRIWNFVK